MLTRLSKAGFAPDFVQRAILPDWWDAKCESDPALVGEASFRVARFLALPLSAVEGAEPLRVPAYPNAQLRRVRDIDADRLAAAIHAGIEIAGAVVRSLRGPAPVTLPHDAIEWVTGMQSSGGGGIGLPAILDDLWRRGVPVVHVKYLPAPKFQALACVVEGRCVILLGHDHDEPARLAVHVAHEFGHVVRGDCEPGVPVLDEEDVPDTSDIEVAAEKFGWTALGGGNEIPPLNVSNDPRELAREASALEATTHVDAGILLWMHGNRTADFGLAQRALRALYRNHGGQLALRERFDKWVDVEGASETDRALLDCVFLAPERDEPAD